jgi:hypothetical protein
MIFDIEEHALKRAIGDIGEAHRILRVGWVALPTRIR